MDDVVTGVGAPVAVGVHGAEIDGAPFGSFLVLQHSGGQSPHGAVERDLESPVEQAMLKLGRKEQVGCEAGCRKC